MEQGGQSYPGESHAVQECELPVHVEEHFLVPLGRPQAQPVKDPAYPRHPSTDLHHGEAAHADDLGGEQDGHRQDHRPRRLKRHERDGKAGRQEGSLSHHHGGLVHDDGGEPLVEREPVAHEVSLERLATDRGRRRQQVRGLSREASCREGAPGKGAVGQEHSPAEGVDRDGHAVRKEHEHGGRPNVPDEPCDEPDADRKEQEPEQSAAHGLPMARRKRSRISSGV